MTEDVTKSSTPAVTINIRPRRRRRKNKPKVQPTPGHAAASACLDADMGKGIMQGGYLGNPSTQGAEQMAASATNYHAGASVSGLNSTRLSESLGRDQGHASVSSGDHNTDTGRNTAVAWQHPDLRQSNTNFSTILSRLQTVRGETAQGMGPSDTTPGGYSLGAQIALASFDAANQAGSYNGLGVVNHDPSRPGSHISQQSATSQNPSYPMNDAVSHAVSNKEAREIMRKAMFGA